MRIKPLDTRLTRYLKKHNLESKFKRQINLFQNNPRHPSLHTEILEPRHRKLYSFRIDRKYRATFVIKNSEAKIIDINDHYQ